MSDTPKLLPYEHDLVKALGVTPEEYLAFLTAQRDYTISPEERDSVVRAEAATAYAVTALVLTIIGAIFQVAAVLLAPRPDTSRNQQRQRREERFSPRYGFNSSQELATYGDTVNLVYCNTNQNPKGAVRLATSLVWSSVESFGSSQFMQLLVVLGASRIKRIAFNKSAFGQLPLGEFNDANFWLYYSLNGRPSYSDKVLGGSKDPSRDGAPASDPVCKIIDGGRRLDGYSQAFSPTSLITIGVYDPIPINVEIQERRTSGRPRWAPNRVTIAAGSWDAGGDRRWNVGKELRIVFDKAGPKQDNVAQEAAKELRYQYVSALDLGSTYMLGTAKFKLIRINDNIDLDDGNVSATFECVEAGNRPYTDYDRQKAKIWSDADREALEDAEDILESPYEEDTVSAYNTLRIKNPTYVSPALRSVTDIEEYRAEQLQVDPVRIKFGGVSYTFAGQETIQWRNELDKRGSYVVPRGGSIAYSKKLLEAYLNNKIKLSTKQVRDELTDDLEKIRQLRDDVLAGVYDAELSLGAKNNPKVRQYRRQIDDLQKQLKYGLNKVIKDGYLAKATDLFSKGSDNPDIDKQIEAIREEKDAFLAADLSGRRRIYVSDLRNDKVAFRGLDGNRYAGGIVYLKKRINSLKGEFTTDQIGSDAIRDYLRVLIAEKEEALKVVRYITKNWEELIQGVDDHFYTKCLVKADSAAYQTVTACDYVKFSMRARVFRRIAGRQKKYGLKDAPEGYKLSDNGVKGRMAFFKVSYRSSSGGAFASPSLIFAVRRSSEQEHFIQLNFQGANSDKREFKFDPIGDIGAEIERNGQRYFAFIENSGKRTRFAHNGNEFWWTGSLVSVRGSLKPALQERGPWYTNEWDLFSVRADTQTQFSFENGPEFSITAVTEQQLGSVAGKYSDMSTMAFSVYSGRGIQDLRSLSAYVREGKNSYVVNESTGAYSLSPDSTSYAPDIFADTILDTNDGIGKYAKPEGVDWDTLALAKRFCKANGLGCQLFMDGVIAEPTSWREFWAQVAPYSLLEFARVGGKETLIPAIPTRPNGSATSREVTIAALFNQGNILEGSYKEEFIDYGEASQDLIATVIYREAEVEDVFTRNASVEVMLRSTVEASAIRQTFDLSQFVSQREQAVLYAKLLCNQRRLVRRALEFKTFPTESPIYPGAYIFIDVGLNTWDRISSGLIMDGGALNSPLRGEVADGVYNVLVYRSGSSTIPLTGVSIAGNASAALAPYAGYLYVLGANPTRKRVFRVTEVQMDEEGEVTVRATEYPCEQDGGVLRSRIADFSDALFRVR